MTVSCHSTQGLESSFGLLAPGVMLEDLTAIVRPSEYFVLYIFRLHKPC